jgi:hypothetical protein
MLLLAALRYDVTVMLVPWLVIAMLFLAGTLNLVTGSVWLVLDTMLLLCWYWLVLDTMLLCWYLLVLDTMLLLCWY